MKSFVSIFLPLAAYAVAQAVPQHDSNHDCLPQGQLEAGEAVLNILELPEARNLRTLLQISGQYGTPQPAEWNVISAEPRSTSVGHHWWANAQYATDEGQVAIDWIYEPPSGYIHLDRWMIDSNRAFQIAESAAVRANVGFDRADYLLKAREFSNEPIWKISLFDRNGNCRGHVFLSAENGEIYRTIWIDAEANRSTGYKGASDSQANRPTHSRQEPPQRNQPQSELPDPRSLIPPPPRFLRINP